MTEIRNSTSVIHVIHQRHQVRIRRTTDGVACDSCATASRLFRHLRLRKAYLPPSAPPKESCSGKHAHGYDMPIDDLGGLPGPSEHKDHRRLPGQVCSNAEELCIRATDR
jgi:hypothetical protein